jgi:MFS family permease
MSHTHAVDEAFRFNIRRLYLYQALKCFSLWMPIWIVFLEVDRHLTLSEVYLIAGVGWVVQAVADIPAGALADVFGRKVTVVCGTGLLTVGLAVLATVPGLGGVAVGYLLWATGDALISGTDMALLYESAKLAGREEEFPRISSNSFQILQASQAASSILGGVLASYRLALPMLITAGLSAVALVVLLRVKEPPTDPADRQGYFAVLRTSGRYLRSHPRVTSLIAYVALVAGIAFFVPFVLFQPEMAAQAVAVGWFGLLFTGLRGSALLGLRYGVKLVTQETLYRRMVTVPLVMTLLFVGVAVSPNWWTSYLAMLLLAAVSGALRPHTADLLNRLVPTGVRATLLSTQSVVMTLFIAVMHPIVGSVADTWGLEFAFVLLAAFSLLPLTVVRFIAREEREVAAGESYPRPDAVIQET